VYLLAGLSWVAFLGERILAALAVFRGDESALARLRGDHDVAR